MNSTARNITWISVILGVGAGATGLYFFAKRNINLAMNYCYSIVSVSNFSISKDRFKVTLGVKILNRSEIAATIQSYSLDIYLNSIRLGKVFSDISQRIEPENSSIVSVTADVSSVGKFTATELLNIALNYANKNNWDKIFIRIKGNLKASIKILGMTIAIPVPLDIKMSLKEIMSDDPNAMACPKDF